MNISDLYYDPKFICDFVCWIVIRELFDQLIDYVCQIDKQLICLPKLVETTCTSSSVGSFNPTIECAFSSKSWVSWDILIILWLKVGPTHFIFNWSTILALMLNSSTIDFEEANKEAFKVVFLGSGVSTAIPKLRCVLDLNDQFATPCAVCRHASTVPDRYKHVTINERVGNVNMMITSFLARTSATTSR